MFKVKDIPIAQLESKLNQAEERGWTVGHMQISEHGWAIVVFKRFVGADSAFADPVDDEDSSPEPAAAEHSEATDLR